jgi:hypothetical protein
MGKASSLAHHFFHPYFSIDAFEGCVLTIASGNFLEHHPPKNFTRRLLKEGLIHE